MKITNGVNDLSCVNLGTGFVESLFFSKICEELTAIQEIDDEIQLGVSLKSVMETHDIWIFNFFENVSFGYIENK